MLKAHCPLMPTPNANFTANLTTILLKLPISVVERANLAGFQPSGDAVEVEGVLVAEHQLGTELGTRHFTYVADTPSNGTLLTSSRSLVGLAFDASYTLEN